MGGLVDRRPVDARLIRGVRPRAVTKYWHGVGRSQGRVHFAGEHTSTYSQGFLNGGVESGDRAAIEVMRAIGVPVPRHLSSLPYSFFS
ncbi:MAG: FAD-dependent oxidoreductase [Actinomycetota bacterium]